MSIQKEIRDGLYDLVNQLNIALERGIKVEFNLGTDALGRYSVQRFDCWTKLPDEGEKKQ